MSAAGLCRLGFTFRMLASIPTPLRTLAIAHTEENRSMATTVEELAHALRSVPGDWTIEVANGHIIVARSPDGEDSVDLGEA